MAGPEARLEEGGGGRLEAVVVLLEGHKSGLIKATSDAMLPSVLHPRGHMNT